MLHRKGNNPGNYAQVQSGDFDDNKFHPKDSKSSNWWSCKRILLLLIFGSLIGFILTQQEYIEQKDAELIKLRGQYNATVQEEEKIRSEKMKLESQMKSIQQQLDESTLEVNAINSHAKDVDKELSLIKRTHLVDEETIAAQTKKIESLHTFKQKIQEHIQVFAKRLLYDKYGPGPYYVEIELEFDPASNVADGADGVTNYGGNANMFTIQLAPGHEMPHTVFWFLEQVTNKLFDGASFYRNAQHIIQGGPSQSNFRTTEIDSPQVLTQKFANLGLKELLFPEYSHNFPHVEYTMGYAKTGPDIYINIMDNTDRHGPGGQARFIEDHHVHKNAADPCIAKVIDGFNAIERMRNSDVNEGNFRGMKHPVAIKHMKLIGGVHGNSDNNGEQAQQEFGGDEEAVQENNDANEGETADGDDDDFFKNEGNEGHEGNEGNGENDGNDGEANEDDEDDENQ